MYVHKKTHCMHHTYINTWHTPQILLSLFRQAFLYNDSPVTTDFISFLESPAKVRDGCVSGGEVPAKAHSNGQLEMSEQGSAPPAKDLFSVKPAQVGWHYLLKSPTHHTKYCVYNYVSILTLFTSVSVYYFCFSMTLSTFAIFLHFVLTCKLLCKCVSLE